MGENLLNKQSNVLKFIVQPAFTIISAILALMSLGVLAYAVWHLTGIVRKPEPEVGPTLLNCIGYAIIALAVFEVAKYIFEEEVVDPREMRHAREARRRITKFLSTIIIVTFLEAVVLVFYTGTNNVEMLLYPTLLLFAGIAMVVGLGAYQRLSAAAENTGDGSAESSVHQREAGAPESRE